MTEKDKRDIVFWLISRYRMQARTWRAARKGKAPSSVAEFYNGQRLEAWNSLQAAKAMLWPRTK